jgi:hypothetical protein
MSTNIKTFSFFAMVLGSAICCGQEGPGKADKAASKRRMAFMQQRVAALKAIASNGERIEFQKNPILRYDDAERGVVDATLWRLGETGRPKAILVLEHREDLLLYEFTGTDDLPKSVQGDGWIWEPRGAGSIWREISDQPPPMESRAARRREISKIARKFSASETLEGETLPLKFLPQAICWYHDEEAGVLDGALFAFAHGTNAEVLVFIEARDGEEADAKWVAGFARLAAAQLDVALDGKAFWSRPASWADQSRVYIAYQEAID